MGKKGKGKDKGNNEPPPPKRRSMFHRLFAGVITLCVLICIAYIGLRMIATTDGFRFYIQEYLSEKWDCTVTIDSSRMTRWLDLRLKGITGYVKEADESIGDFYFQRIRIDLNHPARLRGDKAKWIQSIEVDEVDIEFMEDDQGQKQPAFLYAYWQDLLQVTGLRASAEKGTPLFQDLSQYPADRLNGLPALQIRAVNLIEDHRRKEEVVQIEQAEIVFIPLAIPGRNLHYVSIDVLRGGFARAGFRDLSLEWIGGGHQPTILENRIDWVSTFVPPNRDPRFSDPAQRNAAFNNAAKKEIKPRDSVQFYLQQQAAEQQQAPITRRDVQNELKDALK